MSSSGGPGGGEGAGCPPGQHQLQLKLLTALLPQAGLQVSIQLTNHMVPSLKRLLSTNLSTSNRPHLQLGT
jgi:hypothetical protein